MRWRKLFKSVGIFVLTIGVSRMILDILSGDYLKPPFIIHQLIVALGPFVIGGWAVWKFNRRSESN